MQQCAMIDEFPCLGSDPGVGWALPQGGVYHIPLQLLTFSVELLPRAMGEGDGKLLCPLSVPL